MLTVKDYSSTFAALRLEVYIDVEDSFVRKETFNNFT